MVLKDKPRTGNFADKSGSYEQAIRVRTPVINRGDTVEIEQYFTGYGEIKGAKVVCYPSDDLFNATDSYILTGLKEKKKGLLVFGGGRENPLKTLESRLIFQMQVFRMKAGMRAPCFLT